jgi:hypothetical protein
MSAGYDAVIGVWDGHDAGAALVIDGRVVLALNEERLSGRKLDVGLPVRALAAIRQAAAGRRIAWAPTTSDPAKALTRVFPSMIRGGRGQISADPVAHQQLSARLGPSLLCFRPAGFP